MHETFIHNICSASSTYNNLKLLWLDHKEPLVIGRYIVGSYLMLTSFWYLNLVMHLNNICLLLFIINIESNMNNRHSACMYFKCTCLKFELFVQATQNLKFHLIPDLLSDYERGGKKEHFIPGSLGHTADNLNFSGFLTFVPQELPPPMNSQLHTEKRKYCKF